MFPPPPRSTLFPYTTLFRSGPLLPIAISGRLRLGSRLVGGRFDGRSGRLLGDGRFLRRSVHRPDIGTRVDHALDRKSTRLNSSHVETSYAVFCLKKKNTSCA